MVVILSGAANVGALAVGNRVTVISYASDILTGE